MKNSRETTHALLAAARADGPDFAAREAMWSKLEVAVGFVPAPDPSSVHSLDSTPHASTPSPSAGSVGSVAKASASTVFKAGLLGGGIGSALTIGSVLLAMRVGAVPVVAPAPALDTSHEARLEERAPSIFAPLVTPPAEPEKIVVDETQSAPSVPTTDVLSREVAFVMDARESLLKGDPARALGLARKARALHGQLDREALTLEVRALRALSRDAEADRAEMELRVLHPSR
jgi:hypothetical protein